MGTKYPRERTNAQEFIQFVGLLTTGAGFFGLILCDVLEGDMMGMLVVLQRRFLESCYFPLLIFALLRGITFSKNFIFGFFIYRLIMWTLVESSWPKTSFTFVFYWSRLITDQYGGPTKHSERNGLYGTTSVVNAVHSVVSARGAARTFALSTGRSSVRSRGSRLRVARLETDSAMRW